MVSQTPSPPPGEADVPWQYVPPNASGLGHFVYPKPIKKSDLDKREYKLIRLENGIQAMLIQDPEADHAAASLDVAVGHLSDPDDMPGLAHFCEHLLFMGTEQFPKENEYSEYLAKNGGHSNAFTSTANTNYYFQVGVNALPGALERFSCFFHSPLFSPSCTTRELNAVDSENKKNLHSDMWRIFQLNKHLSKPGHPWSKFGTGNKMSLTAAGKQLKTQGVLRPQGLKPSTPDSPSLPSPVPSRDGSPAPSTASEDELDGGTVGKETRRRLVEWWSKEYCSSRMCLAVLDKGSLDNLTNMVVKLFSPIPHRGQDPRPLILDHPFGQEEMGTIVSVKTVMDMYAFELSFPLAYQAPHWRVKPGNFLCHFIGHEGPGSLNSYLKNKGWITGINSGTQVLGRGFNMFKVTVHLTKEGFRNYRSALLATYKCISLLRSSEFPAWMQQELITLQGIRFRFAERRKAESFAQTTAEFVSHPYPRDYTLMAPHVVLDWNEKDVRDILETLTVNRGRVVLMAKTHDLVGQVGPWEREPWYGTEYKVERIDEEFAAEARRGNDIPELYLPGPNEFIPTNTTVIKRDVAQPLKRPILIKKTPLSSVWHKKDDQFWVPKAHFMMELRSPFANSSARDSVKTSLYTDLVNDALTEYTYDADLASLRYKFTSHTLGVWVNIMGYNDKLHVLARHVAEKARSLRVDPGRLAILKEQRKLEWENFSLGQPHRLSDYWAQYITTERKWTVAEKLQELSDISPDEMSQHIEKLLGSLHVLMLSTGNLRKDEVLAIADEMESILGSKPLSEADRPADRALILPSSCNYIWETPVINPKETNSGLSYYCHVGDIGDARLRVTFRLLRQIFAEPAFNVLRTREQLGYLVYASEWSTVGSIGLRVLIQSEKSPRYTETRVEAFLSAMRDVLKQMTSEEFEQHKQALVLKWTEKLKNLAEETATFWTCIDNGYLDFMRHEKDAVLLQTVTKEEVLSMYSRYLDPSSATRSKLSVHLCPQKTTPKKFSVAASHAFLALLRSNGISIDEERYVELSAAEPPVAAVKAHWSGALTDNNGSGLCSDPATAAMLVDAIEELALKYPVEGEGIVSLRDDVQWISDIADFRKGLTVGPSAVPVEQYHDLPVAKY